ncbi:MAG TPA: PilT/PilU family type 4a pilus ATPase, partial [Actinobacteria bacterium]|nr:PilT/PilU family type 4a pilus ATPase [Actinomycetes bacterium]HEX21607.1 PilT/PilU family type 4a pilus ATPase [Actinomycetota bacterium]
DLPETARSLVTRPRGMLLVTGPAGSGKSTTQAALIDKVNREKSAHIMTIEDPIEFLHTDKKGIINQRQIGRDTLSFAIGLKYVLRQDPDLILIGEMRDLETISLAVTIAETGHLLLGTLHTTDAAQTVDRVINAFPIHQQQQTRMQLSVNLIGVISQLLLQKADGSGVISAFEVMVVTTAIKNCIREGKTHQIPQVMQTGAEHGMISMERSLVKLVNSGVITVDEALAKAPHPEALENLLPVTNKATSLAY